MCFTTAKSLLLGASLSVIAAIPALAQTAATATTTANTASDEGGLADIVVTAQKREQSVQDVPIAVTALTGEALVANRVVTVNDLSGLAPGVTVRPSAGGVGVPSFTIRGAVSYGVVPGSDKQVSIYLDGVYISSPRGSIFDLPDVMRIEMLRGPQGTLFGRNATAGALSVTTRDPSGEMGVKAKFTVGNYDQYRMQLGVDLPRVGPFTGYVSYVHDYKRGDIRNLGAGQVWDRTASPEGTVQVSPKYLGTRDADSYFAALKFEPSDSFTATYKFDYSKSKNTPEGTALVAYDPTFPGVGAVIAGLTLNPLNPVPVAADGKRPDAVFNSFSTVTNQKVQGHSLTSVFRGGDNLTLKNIAAYRKSSILASAPIDGLSAPQVAPGLPFVLLGSTSYGRSEQWSDEQQVNYDSKLLTLTVGALWFHSKDRAGSLTGLAGVTQFSVIPGGVFAPGSQGISYNKATSLAAYTQAEVHVTSQIDLVGGVRITRDSKSGTFVYGLPGALNTIGFKYKNTKPSYLAGVNYKPTNDILVYGKYSTAFVSGGKVGTIPFEPETVASWEGGLKTELFDRRLRTSLAVFYAKYKNVQTATSGSNFAPGTFPNQNDLGTFVISQGGPVTAKGFEFEGTALITRGVTTGGSFSYTKTKFFDVNPALVTSTQGESLPTLRPKFTGTIWGQYESEPISGDARVVLRVDGNWRSKLLLDPNQHRATEFLDAAATSPAHWIVNGRAAVTDIQFGNGPKFEIALWGRNIFNDKSAIYALVPQGFLASVNFEPARTYGLDLSLNF